MATMSSPEPMSLGSPSQSPQGGVAGGPNQYLPQFLLGDLMPSNQSSQLNNRNPNQCGSKYWTNGGNSPPRNPMGPGSGMNYQMGMGMGNSGGGGRESGGMAGSSLNRNYTFNGYDTKNFNSANHYMEKGESSGFHSGGGYHPHHHLSSAAAAAAASASGANNQNYSPHHHSYLHTSERGGNIMGSGMSGVGAQSGSGTNLTGMTSGSSGSVSAGGLERNVQIPGAPPVNRLVDMINKPTFSPINTSAIITPTDSRSNRYTSNSTTTTSPNDYYNLEKSTQELSFNHHHRLSPPSPTQIDPFYAHGESIKVDEKLDETWITIYGFPPSATSYVLQEFSLYGQIIKHISSTQGNWMHIQYQTKLQAQKALSKSGKVLAGSLMIGVMPCIDKKVMESGSGVIKNIDLSSTSPCNSPSNAAASPNPNNVLKPMLNRTMSNNGSKLDRTQSLRTNVRPLGPYNRNLDPGACTTDSIGSSASNSSKLPKKNTGIISKALDFMMGW